MQNRFLIFITDPNPDTTQWLKSRWYDLELYPISDTVFGVNDSAGEERIAGCLNYDERFIILPAFDDYQKMFENRPEDLKKFQQFLYLTEPLPADSPVGLSEKERTDVIDRLLDKIIYHGKHGDQLTVNEAAFLRDLQIG